MTYNRTVMDGYYKHLTKDNCTYQVGSIGKVYPGYDVFKYYNWKGVLTAIGGMSNGVPKSFSSQCSGQLDEILYTTAENLTRIDENAEKLSAELNVERKNNAVLNGEIAKLNATITAQNTDITALKTSVAALNTLLTEFKETIARNYSETKALDEKMTMLTQLLNELKIQIGKVFTFIPKFIRNTSLTFVKMIVGMKTNTLDDSLADNITDSLAIDL